MSWKGLGNVMVLFLTGKMISNKLLFVVEFVAKGRFPPPAPPTFPPNCCKIFSKGRGLTLGGGGVGGVSKFANSVDGFKMAKMEENSPGLVPGCCCPAGKKKPRKRENGLKSVRLNGIRNKEGSGFIRSNSDARKRWIGFRTRRPFRPKTADVTMPPMDGSWVEFAPCSRKMKSAPFSAIIIVVASVGTETMVGMMDASITRRPRVPRTLKKIKLKKSIRDQGRYSDNQVASQDLGLVNKISFVPTNLNEVKIYQLSLKYYIWNQDDTKFTVN